MILVITFDVERNIRKKTVASYISTIIHKLNKKL